MSAALSMSSGALPSSALAVPRNVAQALATKLLKLPLSAIAEVLGCDESGACRVRANERPCTLMAWLRLVDLCGYKLVSKEKECIPADELRMLRRCYAQHHEALFDEPE